MDYGFDSVTDRRNTGSLKWDVKENELPMWVADMDFKTAPCIIEAVKKCADHGVFGYSVIPDEWAQSYIGWWKTRHGLDISPEELIFCTGVVPAISSCVRKLTTPAEKVLCSADWLILALFKHPGFNALRSRLGYEPYADGPDCPGGLPEIAVSFPAEGAAPKEDKAEVYDADPALSSILRESFLMSPDSRLTENEAKLTVSEIVKDDALSFFPRVPSLDGSLEELSAAQRGTITHRFMQYCDFDAADRDLEWEISRLEAANIFTPKEAAAISRRGVAGFFKSGIYSRLRRSGSVLRERQFIVRFDDIDLPGGLAEIYRGTDGMLQGIADCLFEEEGGYVLVDYKTDRVKTADKLLDKYSAQLVLYKAAFDALLSKPVKSCFIYSFHLGEGIEIKI